MSQDRNTNQAVFGVTGPISTTEATSHDIELTKKLVEVMSTFGVYESEEDLQKRFVYNAGSIF